MAVNNVAYDFSRFEASEVPKTASETRRQPQLKVVSNRRPVAKSNPLTKLGLVLLMVVMIVMVIYSQVVLSELSTQISSAQSRLTALESESTRLSAQITSAGSSQKLEEYAVTKLGLSKMEADQITYVNMHEQDRSRITTKGQEKTGAEMISGTAGEIMEYLKLK
ncbi:MAG: hypothetical protein IKU72_03030 [Oscillospiraceae bacterium]|nr:hypothetical protein [Oscillospiraceae bacterium]